jgi:hypothetical protein
VSLSYERGTDGHTARSSILRLPDKARFEDRVLMSDCEGPNVMEYFPAVLNNIRTRKESRMRNSKDRYP